MSTHLRKINHCQSKKRVTHFKPLYSSSSHSLLSTWVAVVDLGRISLGFTLLFSSLVSTTTYLETSSWIWHLKERRIRFEPPSRGHLASSKTRFHCSSSSPACSFIFSNSSSLSRLSPILFCCWVNTSEILGYFSFWKLDTEWWLSVYFAILLLYMNLSERIIYYTWKSEQNKTQQCILHNMRTSSSNQVCSMSSWQNDFEHSEQRFSQILGPNPSSVLHIVETNLKKVSLKKDASSHWFLPCLYWLASHHQRTVSQSPHCRWAPAIFTS